MTLKVVIMGARLNSNLGGPSLYVSTEKAIQNYQKDVEFKYFTQAGEYRNDHKEQDLYGADVLPLEENYLALGGLIYRLLRIFPFPRYKNSHGALKDADLIVDVWGIMFTDYLGKNTFINRFREGLRLLLGKIYGIPVVKATAALGPFEFKWNRRLAVFYLKHCVDRVMTRDEKSFNEVNKIGVTSDVYLTADTAFLLPHEEISPLFKDNSQGNVLVSVSHQATSRASNEQTYLDIVSNFIKHTLKSYDTTVTILPNAIVAEDDDLRIAQKISDLVASESCKLIDPTGMTAMQVKGVVAQASVVVASRYHTVIAALSLGKPTISIGWHHKYRGVLGLFGMEDWDMPVDKLEFVSLQKKFDELWKHRRELSQTIAQKLPDVKTHILQTFQKVLSSVLEN